MTKIEWCDKTVNPVMGCTYGCDYCYARKMNQRFKWIKDFECPQFFHHRLQRLYTKEPQIIFINSMSDIADWKPTWLSQVITAIENNPQNTYLALTKRPSQLTDDVYDCKPENLWIGQTITEMCGGKTFPEVIHPQVDFLSIEPLMGQIELKLLGTNVKWVIAGAETGNRKGKVVPDPFWAGYIEGQCMGYKIPLFFKNSMKPIVDIFMVQHWPEYIQEKHKKENRGGR